MAVDRTRFNFNGKSRLTKKKLIFEIVKKYIDENNDILIEDLISVFSHKSDFNIDMFVDDETYQSFNYDRKNRYFEEPFVLRNGENIYLSTQWGGEVFKSLLEKIKNNLNYDIQIYSQDTVVNNPIVNEEEQEFRNKYKRFVDTLPLQNSEEYAKLYTESQNKPFKVNKNSSGSIVVRAFTQQSSPMVISANQLSKVVFNNDRYLYSSYEPVLISRIQNELIVRRDEVVEDIDLNSLPHTEVNKIKNIILYGSPGVGKTHNTKKLISLIESGNSEKEIFETIKNNEVNNGLDIDNIKDRVKFVTFHQSFGYEDFIEGFRPNEDGNIELKEGVFRIICTEAQNNLDISGREQSFDFENFLNDFMQEVENQGSLDLDQGLSITTRKKSNGDFQAFKVGGRVKNQSLTKDIIKRDFELFLNGKIKQYKDVKPTFESKSSYHGNAPYYYKLYGVMEEYLSASGYNYKSDITEIKNYYLVIDEINRGNISKIFGELITLIEEDKRDTLEVTLPYSKQTFKIPSNLYIIGTMNSTDKSIALIDIALRRRFTFLRMEPKPDLVNHDKAQNIMIQINEKITNALGADYVLGHSYFMKIENDDDLDFVLEYKVIPLLEEYYYGDENGLNDVLKICNVNNMVVDDNE